MYTRPPSTPDDGSRPPDPSSLHLELFRTLLAPEPLDQVLDRVAHLARAAVPGIDEVSVTLVEDGLARSVVFTDDLAVQLDQRQYQDGSGPCLDAARTGQVIQVPDTSTEQRYPGLAQQAEGTGVTRIMSLGVPVAGDTAGALNLFGRSGHGFDDGAVSQADTFAGHAAAAFANAASHARALRVAQMRQAMASRAVIEQAKGMVMTVRLCSPDEAFAELSRLSTLANRKVRDVAEELVAGHGSALR